jgi:hypothetical protein
MSTNEQDPCAAQNKRRELAVGWVAAMLRQRGRTEAEVERFTKEAGAAKTEREFTKVINRWAPGQMKGISCD